MLEAALRMKDYMDPFVMCPVRLAINMCIQNRKILL